MSSKQLEDGEVLAYIGAVVRAVPEGKQPFVVAYPQPGSVTEKLTKDTSITFPLSGWSSQAHGPLRHKRAVILEGVDEYPKGWRATSARPVISSKQRAGEDK